MSENILNDEQTVSAEAWLMPELSGHQVLRAQQASTGYKKSSTAAVVDAKPSVAERMSSGPMTASKLLDIEKQVREEAEKAGRAQGYEQGYREGELRAKTENKQYLQATEQQLAHLLDSMSVQLQRQQADLTQVLSNLIIDATKIICQRELNLDNSSIEAIVTQALEAIPSGEASVTIQLHPDDLRCLQGLPDFVQAHWQLQADDKLQLGDCRIITDESLIDFTCNARLQQILEQGLLA